jgi:hypothetical protein
MDAFKLFHADPEAHGRAQSRSEATGRMQTKNPMEIVIQEIITGLDLLDASGCRRDPVPTLPDARTSFRTADRRWMTCKKISKQT